MEERFKTPEEIASKDNTNVTVVSSQAPTSSPKKLNWIHRLSKKQKIIGGILIALLLIGGTTLVYALTHQTKKATSVVAVKSKPKPVVPTTVASKLTGLQVKPEINNGTVTGVMIENSTFARPQSGLVPAGVVFEAVAEGGITRFLALYLDLQPTYVGPIRSVRPYYLQWALGFDAAVAHVGGSPEALADIKAWGAKDLDEFANASSYTRIKSRVAPHNVYTGITNLNSLEASKGFKSSFTGFARKAEAPAKTPTARTIDINMSSAQYNPHYNYDAKSNTYTRIIAGQLQTDENPSAQIAPKVVIAMVMNQGIEPDDKHTSYATVGSGALFVFQDGLVTQGTWQKATNNAQLQFLDAQNNSLKLNPGQTWISIANASAKVTYAP